MFKIKDWGKNQSEYMTPEKTKTESLFFFKALSYYIAKKQGALKKTNSERTRASTFKLKILMKWEIQMMGWKIKYKSLKR